MERLIRDWLDWLKIRTRVLTEANRSTVVAWLYAHPHRNEEWSQARHDLWCDQINASLPDGSGDVGVSVPKPLHAGSKRASSFKGLAALVPDAQVAMLFAWTRAANPERAGFVKLASLHRHNRQPPKSPPACRGEWKISRLKPRGETGW